MIQHVVMVELKGTTSGEEADSLAADFREMSTEVEGVLESTAGIDFSGRCLPYTLIAVLRLGSRDDLARYSSHPKHLQLVGRLDELAASRIVADYEVEG